MHEEISVLMNLLRKQSLLTLLIVIPQSPINFAFIEFLVSNEDSEYSVNGDKPDLPKKLPPTNLNKKKDLRLRLDSLNSDLLQSLDNME